MLFFLFNMNRQKLNAKLQAIKSVLSNAYILTENSQMLSIINQIDQYIKNYQNQFKRRNINISAKI